MALMDITYDLSLTGKGMKTRKNLLPGCKSMDSVLNELIQG